jgi:hypothetical protein
VNHLLQERNNPTSFYTLLQTDKFSKGISPPKETWLTKVTARHTAVQSVTPSFL